MNHARVLYHLVRADFYERVRRHSFLVMLALMVFLGYQIAIGNVTLNMGKYHGEFNSAWVGSMLTAITSVWLSMFGFYLIKGAIARDRETGVGQIIATTPLSRPLYMIGKWLSNLAVLLAMVAVLMVAGIFIQLWAGGNMQIDLFAYLTPFLFIVLPTMAFTAAIAVLFESVWFLQGGFGNVVYYILFIFTLAGAGDGSSFDLFGIKLLADEIGRVLSAVHPDYTGGFGLGPSRPDSQTFLWLGFQWRPELLLARAAIVGLALGVTLLAAFFFDRFDSTKRQPRQKKIRVATDDQQTVSAPKALAAPHLTALSPAAKRYSFFNVLQGELKLLLKGQRWWWYAIAAIFVMVCFGNDAATIRKIVLPLTLIWPILIWSSMGNRESYHNVRQMIFASASPLWRQLPAQWLAGFIVTALIGSGAALRFLGDGDMSALIALCSTTLFIPSLALAAGVWSGSSKLFEILYLTLWYAGPMNHAPGIDFVGLTNNGRAEFFIPLALALIVFAFFGRARQLQN